MSFRFRALPLLALIGTLAACGKTEKAPDADSLAKANAPAPVAPAPVSVKDIDLGRSINPDKSINDHADAFKSRDTMYISVRTDGVGDAVLAVRWSTAAGKLIDSSSQPITGAGEARTEFHIMKKSAWPAGDYQVDVLLNGVSAGSKPFTVKRP
ncbi:MAG: hypothetical protein ABJC19_09590 [Gemmatimonadota bacterium]